MTKKPQPPGASRRGATLQQVADRAGVSIATASHVLTGKKFVGDELSTRVRQAAGEIGYRPNRAARALRTGQTHTLGLVVPDIANPFFSQLAQAVRVCAHQAGYATVLIETGYPEDLGGQGPGVLSPRSVDGLIWVVDGRGALRGRPAEVPTVVLHHAPPDWYAVYADDYAGGRLLAELARRDGHRRVAALWGDVGLGSIQARRQGFLDHLGPGITVGPELEAPFALELPPDIQQQVLEVRGQCSLLVCGNDVLAIAAIHTFKAAGWHLPQDISVTGYDDTSFAVIVDPPLTTITMPTTAMGTQAVELLLTQLRGEAHGPRQLVLPVTLVERRSTRPQIVPEAAP